MSTPAIYSGLLWLYFMYVCFTYIGELEGLSEDANVVSAMRRKVMSYSNDFGPKWTVNSEELGGGVVALLAVMAALFVLAPAFILGVRIGASIWNAKIFKYPLGALFAYAYFDILATAWITSHELAFAIVTASWVIADYIMANSRVDNMVIVRSLKKTVRWLFGA